MFVAIVDDQARTYRYHHLIKEVLQIELHARDPAREKQLHEAAAHYLIEAGQAGAAARHLLAAGEQAAAVSLLNEGVVRDVLTNPAVASALDLDEIRPELFADAPEFLVPLAAELLWRGAFERGSRAVAVARQCRIDPGRQPELAVRLALVNMLHCTFIGQFDEALAHREQARPFETMADGVGDWIVTLDTLGHVLPHLSWPFQPSPAPGEGACLGSGQRPADRGSLPRSDQPGRLHRRGPGRGWRLGR